MRIEFLGAAGSVTGSRYLLEQDGHRQARAMLRAAAGHAGFWAPASDADQEPWHPAD
jgi:hypothetical protein